MHPAARPAKRASPIWHSPAESQRLEFEERGRKERIRRRPWHPHGQSYEGLPATGTRMPEHRTEEARKRAAVLARSKPGTTQDMLFSRPIRGRSTRQRMVCGPLAARPRVRGAPVSNRHAAGKNSRAAPGSPSRQFDLEHAAFRPTSGRDGSPFGLC